MDWESSIQCHPRAGQNMHDEAEFISTELSSRSVAKERDGLDQLRCDMLALPDAQLLALEDQMRHSTRERGLNDPLRRLPETDRKWGFNRFTGDELVVLTNPFDQLIETVRLTHEHSFSNTGDKMLYFDSRVNALLDHRPNIAAVKNEEILQGSRHHEKAQFAMRCTL
jgi:hypothetical protein